jgi:hypothetical protein
LRIQSISLGVLLVAVTANLAVAADRIVIVEHFTNFR